MAATYDVGVQIHVGASPLCTAAALQLECGIPGILFVLLAQRSIVSGRRCLRSKVGT